MGVLSGDFDVADDLQPPVNGEAGPLAPLVQQAMDNRPELRSLAQSFDAQKLLATAARGRFLPSVGVSAGAGASGPAAPELLGSWNFGATLTWPLIEGGLAVGQLHQAEANQDVIDAQIKEAQLQIQLDVETAQLNVRASEAALEASREALVNAREQLRLAEARYTSGVGSAIERQDAQTALTAASAQVVQAQYNLSVARAQLVASLGFSS
jgi:outer membrane protein TolC